jgi:hypothetical protein
LPPQAELDALTEEPHHVMLCPETVSLLGVKHFFHEVSGTASVLLTSTLYLLRNIAVVQLMQKTGGLVSKPVLHIYLVTMTALCFRRA